MHVVHFLSDPRSHGRQIISFDNSTSTTQPLVTTQPLYCYYLCGHATATTLKGPMFDAQAN